MTPPKKCTRTDSQGSSRELGTREMLSWRSKIYQLWSWLQDLDLRTIPFVPTRRITKKRNSMCRLSVMTYLRGHNNLIEDVILPSLLSPSVMFCMSALRAPCEGWPESNRTWSWISKTLVCPPALPQELPSKEQWIFVVWALSHVSQVDSTKSFSARHVVNQNRASNQFVWDWSGMTQAWRFSYEFQSGHVCSRYFKILLGRAVISPG